VPRGRRRGAPRLDAQRRRLGGALGAAVGARRAERGGRRAVRRAATAAQVRAHVVQHRLRAGDRQSAGVTGAAVYFILLITKRGCGQIPMSQQGSTAWCEDALPL